MPTEEVLVRFTPTLEPASQISFSLIINLYLGNAIYSVLSVPFVPVSLSPKDGSIKHVYNIKAPGPQCRIAALLPS